MVQKQLSPAVPKPDHIPDSVVYDFDMFADPAYTADPHKRVLDLYKNAPPIFWTPRYGGHWMFVSHAANFDAARDTESFSNAIVPREYIKAMLAKLPPNIGHIPQAFPITLDPPEHTTYRMPLQRVFSPKTVNTLKDSIRSLAAELIDPLVNQGGCDFMAAVAEPLPVQVFLKMLGLPLDRMPEYRALLREHLSEVEPDAMKGVMRLQKVAAIMRDVVLDRRDNPQDDIISMLWKVEIDGKPTTLADLENFGVLLYIAGLDTVMNGIGHGIRHLAENPDLQKQLRANPELIGEATEELLRRYTFTVPPRRVAKDIEFHGLKMKENDRVMLFLPGADLDSKEYPHSEKFDLNRENKTHIAFNAGPHRCLGSHLARVELQICYEEVLKRLPEFRLDPAHKLHYHCGHVVGPAELHLLWGK
jgi:cytochrome P450